MLASPVPSWPVRFRAPGFERFRFEARGLSSLAVDAVTDALADTSESARGARIALDLAVLSLHVDGVPAFANAEALGSLPVTLANALVNATHDALEVCSPLYGRSDGGAWHRVLTDGARAAMDVVSALGGCVDDGPERTTERPDRYFGVPLCALTDGQWMAYRAAREVLEGLRARSRPMAKPRARPVRRRR